MQQYSFALMILALVLVACGPTAALPTPGPPTATPVPPAPTALPTVAPTVGRRAPTAVATASLTVRPTTSVPSEPARPTGRPASAPPATAPPLLYLDQGALFQLIAGDSPRRLAAVPEPCVLCAWSTAPILAATRIDNAVLVLLEQGLRRIRLADGASDLVLRFDFLARFGSLTSTADGAHAIYTVAVDDRSAPMGFVTHMGLYQASSNTVQIVPTRSQAAQYATVQPLGLTADGRSIYLLPRGGDPGFDRVLVATSDSGAITAELPIEGVGGAFLSPDRRYIITRAQRVVAADGSVADELHLYDLTRHPIRAQIIPLPTLPSYGAELLWTPDSQAVHLLLNSAPGEEGMAYRLWRLDIGAGELVQEAAVAPPKLLGHATVLHPRSISPDGQWLLLQPESENGAILFHVPTGASMVVDLPAVAVVAGWH
jgi:hypothetical protein